MTVRLTPPVHPRPRGEHVQRARPKVVETVHPRPRGEHSARIWTVFAPVGSSPPARGTPCVQAVKYYFERFIPARAGNTILGWHSSPPARGTHRLPHFSRFIPARAGNTAQPLGRGRPTTVHPRPRGELGPRRPPTSVHPRPRGEHAPSELPSCTRPRGSSPPARGTHFMSPRLRLSSRFIPARAGNTMRSRGSRPYYVTDRFIPARAGNTSDRSLSPRDRVHPRPRGEHLDVLRPARAGNTSSCHGSSPPARGTRRSLGSSPRGDPV